MLLRSVFAGPLAGKAPSEFETRHKRQMLLWAPHSLLEVPDHCKPAGPRWCSRFEGTQ